MPVPSKTMPPTLPSPQQYSTEDVQTILARALELKSAAPYSATQLAEMAAELEVPPHLLAAAEADWRSQQATQAETEKSLVKRRRRQRQQWIKFGLGSLLMISIDIATAGTLTWAFFPIMGWGFCLAIGSDRCQHKRASL